ncbi:hypothetical protein L218DRAFT_226110 [Marasmius fiardii PR-910]|nr:hypothetical protein L218DRAFT_226110 [Marasmius fiardii PR-910]
MSFSRSLPGHSGQRIFWRRGAPDDGVDCSHSKGWNFNGNEYRIWSSLSYLERSLKALSLYTEARTSFITWHTYKRPRWTSLPVRISSRGFPCFFGALLKMNWNLMQKERDGERLLHNLPRTPSFGKILSVVKAVDVSLFRVLEWGGMEVF